jgi:hypothetical protein
MWALELSVVTLSLEMIAFNFHCYSRLELIGSEQWADLSVRAGISITLRVKIRKLPTESIPTI